MKKFFACVLTALFALLSVFFLSCGEGNTTFAEYDEVVKIVVQTDEELSLKEYMDGLMQEGEFVYEIESGMVVSINGVSNTDKYWMLYTDDIKNANTAYGVKHEGKNYYSANYGAEALTVEDGHVYLWAYHGF